MEFTVLHRLLGRQPSVETLDELLEEAIEQRIAETDDLDWKRQLPSENQLAQSDTVKDLAAMANSGGGLIVFGVEEVEKQATGRIDVGEVSESYERTLRRVAVSGVQPPIFNLTIHRLGIAPTRALAVEVPPSVDGPHLIYRGEYFGAPIRNNADTEWMRERQLEAAYRARFDERRASIEALEGLFGELASGRDTQERAWLIAAARPRLPFRGRRLTREEARIAFNASQNHVLALADRQAVHPLERIDVNNPRIGLRRWIAPPTALTDWSRWLEAWVSIHDDGSVALAAGTGGHRNRTGEGYLPGNRLDSAHLEACVATLFALIHAVSDALGTTDYEAKVGIEWQGSEPLIIQAVDITGYPFDTHSTPLARYTPVAASIRAGVDADEFLRQARDVATDVINQGGVNNLRVLRQPTSAE